jgi:hypothetical protein
MATKGTRQGTVDKGNTAIKPSEFTGINNMNQSLAATMKLPKYPKRPAATDSERVKQKFEQDLAARNMAMAEQTTGLYTVGVLMGRGGVDQDSLKVLDFREYVEAAGERPARSIIVQRYKIENARLKVGKSKTPIAEIADTRIIVLRGRPRIQFDKRTGDLVQPNDMKTQQQMIVQFVNSVKNIQKETITIKNIVGLVQNSTYAPSDAALAKLKPGEINQRAQAKQKQTPLLASVLKTFIKTPDQGQNIFPVQIVPKANMLPKKYAIAAQNSIAVDFGEVIGPIALVMGNVTGNAQRVSREFLGATTQELMKSATIHYNPTATDPLYDSFIQYDNKIIGVSSKGHTAGSHPSGGTAMNGLKHAINDVKTNKTSLKLLRELLKDEENRNMFNVASALADSAERGDKFEKTLRIIQLMYPRQYKAAEMYSDIKHIGALLKTMDATPYRDADDSTRQAMTSRILTGLSPYLQARFNNDPGRAQKEDTTFLDKFLRLTNAEIVNTLNNSQRFSDVVAWLLNHSALVQIDLFTSNPEPKARVSPQGDYSGAIVITNIVATWPSTRVDHIKLVEGRDDLRFMIAVNGYEKQFKNREDIPWVDTDFRDKIAPQSGDRDGSDLTTAQDWSAQGVNRARTSTDLHDLPTNDTQYVPPEKPVKQPRVPGQSRQARQVTQPQSAAIERITTFLNQHHIDDQTATPASSYRFAVKILSGKIDNPAVITNFIALMNDPTISQLVKRDTIDSINHPAGIMNEAKYSDEDVVHTITFIYWALTFKRYIEAGKTSTPQYTEVKNTLIKVGNALIKDGGWNQRFNSAVAQLERPAQNTAQQAASDPNSEIQQLRAKMTPANRQEFDTQVRGVTSKRAILKSAREYAALRESRILKGILT